MGPRPAARNGLRVIHQGFTRREHHEAHGKHSERKPLEAGRSNRVAAKERKEHKDGNLLFAISAFLRG